MGDSAGLTVSQLVEDCGLELAVGGSAADEQVRWVHITELDDPTPWLSGGELLLTTGMQLGSAPEQREFARLLKRSGVAGLGLGTGFDHERLPDPLLEAARQMELPLFEVPYRMPFIAITEKAFTHIVNAGYETLRRGSEINRRLERLVLQERGLDELVAALGAEVDSPVAVLDPRGETVAASPTIDEVPEEGMAAVATDVAARSGMQSQDAPQPFSPGHPSLGGRAVALPVATRGGPPQAWLVATPNGEPPGEFERLILQQAVTVVALELMRLRAARDTERRLAGDILADAVSGRMEQHELERRLRPFGVGGRAAVCVFSVEDPGAGERVVDRIAADMGVGALVATRGELLCAVVDADEVDPHEFAVEARRALAGKLGAARGASSRPAAVGDLRRSFHEARCALEASALGEEVPEVASYRDLGAFQLLLSLQDDEALRLYCDSLLGPLEDGGGDYGDELIRSLEAFIENNGQWERAARQLYCHRHTLRYRIGRIEELTGRDLSRARDRIEFWLALRGRELIG
jgi:purine catabolism regulator